MYKAEEARKATIMFENNRKLKMKEDAKRIITIDIEPYIKTNANCGMTSVYFPNKVKVCTTQDIEKIICRILEENGYTVDHSQGYLRISW